MGLSSSILDSSTVRSGRRKTKAATSGELAAALAREAELRDQLERQNVLKQEFEHRLVNSMQLVTSLLSLQSRNAASPEAAAQLRVAANRVAAITHVHRRLHLLDNQNSVNFRQYARDLCGDIGGLLNQPDTKRTIHVTGAEIALPTKLAVPLGFIINELITNSAKHGSGDITIRISKSPAVLVISVTDEGPGLPSEFDPLQSKGLGMTIIQSLARQIGGVFRFETGAASPLRFWVEFST